jgi:hypothetical protein
VVAVRAINNVVMPELSFLTSGRKPLLNGLPS